MQCNLQSIGDFSLELLVVVIRGHAIFSCNVHVNRMNCKTNTDVVYRTVGWGIQCYIFKHVLGTFQLDFVGYWDVKVVAWPWPLVLGQGPTVMWRVGSQSVYCFTWSWLLLGVISLNLLKLFVLKTSDSWRFAWVFVGLLVYIYMKYIVSIIV